MVDEAGDRTLSPYFLVTCDRPEPGLFPLGSTSADITITGVIADVTVTQLYRNEGTGPIDAVYVFPASTRAAVYSMKMTIGDRVVRAKIRKKEDARKEYEQARNEGKSASLLEQHRPNVFQMNVANIMPGDIVKVELKYTELIVPEERIYEFVYPTVSGPRYAAPAGSEDDRWVQTPYTHEGKEPLYDLDIQVRIDAGMPVRKVHSTSHRIEVDLKGGSSANVSLDNSEKKGGNRDFILRYALAGKEVDSGLLLYRGEKENFFFLMMQPPERVRPSDIPGREYIFIVDISGSMYGFPLDTSKELMRNLIGKLRPDDRFNVLLFAGGSSLMAEESVRATEPNIRSAVSFIDSTRGGGGTEILPALERALALPARKNYSRTIVIATDGYVHVEDRVFDTIRNNLGQANLFAFGIGASVNRHLIEGLAYAGMGEPYIVTHPGKAAAEAARFQKMIEHPVLTNIAIDFNGLDVYAIEPRSMPDLLAERPIMVFGKWQGEPKGTVTIRGIHGQDRWNRKISVDTGRFPENGSALQYLWARHRIRILSDYAGLNAADEHVQEITNLGLTYSLLTKHTSFVAVDSEIRNMEGGSSTIIQPLPLPEGVSNYAAGSMKMMKYSAPPSAMSTYRAQQEMSRMTADVGKDGASGGLSLEDVISDVRGENNEPSIKVEEFTLSSGLRKENIMHLIKAQKDKIISCAMAEPYPIKLRVTMTIDTSGTVSSVRIIREGLRGDTAAHCLAIEIKKWRFPRIHIKKGAEVSFLLIVK